MDITNVFLLDYELRQKGPEAFPLLSNLPLHTRAEIGWGIDSNNYSE